MNRLKNLIYNKSDLFIALMIVLIAGLLIFFRINVLMNYPSRVIDDPAANALYSQEDGEAAQTSEGAVQPEGGGETAQTGEEGGTTVDPETPSDTTGGYPYTLTIDYGQPLSELAQTLVGLGYFESVSEFNEVCKKYGADTKIQSGTFTIPRNATQVEILSIITKTDLTAQ